MSSLLHLFPEEYNIYQSGLLPSKFYAALTAKDSEAFKQALWISAVVVASVCVVSLLKLSTPVCL